MDSVRLAPAVGSLASFCVALVLAVPYFILDPSSVAGYYGNGAVNPLIAGLFALVSIIVFAAGRAERSDPYLMASIGFVFGLFILLSAGLWALTVPIDLIRGMPVAQEFEYHRYILVLTALVVSLSGIWYAQALNLLGGE